MITIFAAVLLSCADSDELINSIPKTVFTEHEYNQLVETIDSSSSEHCRSIPDHS